MNFDSVINKYKNTENIKFIKQIKHTTLYGNWEIRQIETNDGIMYVVETDNANNYGEVLAKIGEAGFSAGFLYEVKEQIDNFENSDVFKHSTNKQKPEDWDNLKRFANDSLASKNYYFTFLAG